MDKTLTLLPGQTFSAGGRRGIDYRSVATLAFPFMVNSAVQAVLNSTDTWFVSRLSPTATAAIGAVYWPVLVFVFLIGGVAFSVQTLVSQAYGGGRYARASQAAWTALWASGFTFPIFCALALSGAWLFRPFGIPAETERFALEYWFPRMLGAPLGVAVWSLLGFFNGIGRPALTLRISVAIAVLNALFNQLLVVDAGWGVAGSAWATGLAQAAGLGGALFYFLRPDMRGRFSSDLTFRLHGRTLVRQFRLGMPMGLLYAADITGFALFQLMQVRLSTVDGAASQLVMVLTSFCYMPAVGIAMAGTTLVGQAIGGGHREWAARVGNGIISITVLYTGLIGLLLAAGGPWILPLFTNRTDPQSGAVVAKGCAFLWIAAGYQLFDGLNISSSACLRGAGDALIPAAMVFALSWLLFVPLTHSLSFAPGQGWVDWLPAFGYGATGGWFAALVYICCVGVVLFWRWRSGAWRRIVLHIR